MASAKKLSFLIFLLCIKFSLRNQAARDQEPLRYDYYHESCPTAEDIIRLTVQEMYAVNKTVAPALLRLLFHDCFVMGCDASVLLDNDGHIKSEKNAPPNLSLKGFEQIDLIKSRLEEECPGVVSCADILALAARESVVLSGGQFYLVLTGRKDSMDAFLQSAGADLPHPDFDLEKALESFASRGFDAKEMVALLGGGHSIGKVHCNFIIGRLSDFKGTKKPDPSIDPRFLEVLKTECNLENTRSTSSSEDRGMKMDYRGPGKDFGEVYYSSLLQNKGLLFVDQELTSKEETNVWVESYNSENLRFRVDFGQAIYKLSHLHSSNEGEVRLNCRRLN